MPSSWQTQDHKAFFDEHLALYVRHRDEGKTKEFWSMIVEKWLKRWPLSEPPVALVAKEGSVKAQKTWKDRKVNVSVTRRRLAPT
jgi:hypothetical protein